MAMNSEKISVIIPIYQVEKYLEKCIHSIIAQTYRNLEIILVDDGSTDASPAICYRFRSEDSRINVIHQANGGCPEPETSVWRPPLEITSVSWTATTGSNRT